ncbi:MULTISPECIES: hypothetical protein [unclassified Corynebacterium]|uniref:hypothetical protein n=1 Tax=unclassified Corynebacterium TaxID=2624378 RepID=UPI0034CF1DF6
MTSKDWKLTIEDRTVLLRFYFFKAWREQWKALLLLPLLAFVVALALAATVYFFPDALTGASLGAVKSGVNEIDAESRASLGPESSLLVAAVISQAPLIASLFAGLIGANTVIGMADIEVRSGAIEIVLSRGYGKRDIVLSLALIAVFLTAIATLVLVLAFYGASAVFLAHKGLAADSLWKILVLPWPCLAMGIGLGLTIQLLFPGLSRVKAGTSGNIAQLLAMLPTVAMFVVFTFSPKAAQSTFAAWCITACFLLLAVALVSVVATTTKVGRLLQR